MRVGTSASRAPSALNLNHDQSCTDTSRLFYLPRRPADGPPPETAVIDGTPCDIFALPAAPQPGDGGTSSRRTGNEGCKPEQIFVDKVGVGFDLLKWSSKYCPRFEIALALKVRRPDILVAKGSDINKQHIRCPNENAHSQPGEDSATFCVNASARTGRKGFVIHYRHAHCTDRDRALFVRQMLEQGWLRSPTFCRLTSIRRHRRRSCVAHPLCTGNNCRSC